MQAGCKQESDLDPLDQAADLRFSRMILGCRAAIRRSAIAGPSGLRRPRSQLRSVCTLIPDRSSELMLSQVHEASQRNEVLSGLEASGHEPLPKASGDRLLELLVRQFTNVCHLVLSMRERNKSRSRLLASRAPMTRTTFSSGSV
jgi:hypothetical protein